MRQTAEVLVIGGGPAGAAAAAALAEAGRRVVLIERTPGPHDKVCGEFISREAAQYLHALGIEPAALGAEPIEAVRLSAGGPVAAAVLPFAAFSLSRRVLDEALLQGAAERGAQLRRGVPVRALTRDSGGWQARLADGAIVAGDAVFLATGKHDVKGWSRPPGHQPDLVAFKMHWQLAPGEAAALARHVELVLFAGGYAGLEPIEGGRANLCLLVRRRRLTELGGSWPRLIAAIRSASPLLDARLSGAISCWQRPLALASIPYGYILPATVDGPFRLGDQAAVIPSFAGDGMAIALHSARLATRCHLDGGSVADYRRRLARDLRHGVRLATLLSLSLVRRPGQRILATAAWLQPRLMARVAGATRVPDAALHRAGLERSLRPDEQHANIEKTAEELLAAFRRSGHENDC
ncbi:MAG: NAD(P)/FAD-dependent oxidoreductase [Rhodoplanes sp.]